MDLVVFENNKPWVIDEFREGHFDYVELASDVAETKFFQFLFGQQVVDRLVQHYPSPRDRHHVPLWMYVCSQLTLRLHGQHSFHSYPLIVRAGGLVDALGPEVARRQVDPESGNLTLECAGFNNRNLYPRQTPCDQDFLRKLAREGLSQEGGFPGGSLWTIPLGMCSIVGELTPISIDGGSPMSTITQRIASAFVVLCGRYGDVTKMAHDREQSRQSLYREASQVANAVDGTAVQSRIDELQRQLAGQQAQIQDLQERLEHAIEITRDKQDEFASVAQAEGVSLSVARRLLQVVAGSVTTPSVPTLGRATEEAGQRAGQLLEVIDEVAQPKVKQATADEIFLGPNRS